jgi:hypothetical protein
MMMTPNNNHNTWLATAMVNVAVHIDEQAQPFQAYLCYWMAWTNLYKSLAKQAGLHPHFGLRKNGTLRIKRNGDIKMAEVYAPTEKAQMNRAIGLLSTPLKHQLITHPNTRYFVYRTPTWHNKALKQDTFGQALHGVLNINQTLDPRYPVWSFIDMKLYRRYTEEAISPKEEEKARNTLAKQIIEVLHTIQENLIHGDTQPTDNHTQVVERALPVLALLVTSLLKSP